MNQMSGIDRVAVFAKTGEYWSLSLDGKTVTIRNFRGLTYVQCLLRHPNEEFHAIDLQASCGGEATLVGSQLEESQRPTLPGRGDAGEMLDPRAKAEYRRRLAELREKLEDARERGALDLADKLQSEIEFLAREISRAVGLGGRDRRAASSSERARLNVTRAIRAAVQHVSAQHPSLGRQLQLCIKTGTFCSYNPSSDAPTDWRFSDDDAILIVDRGNAGQVTTVETARVSSELRDRTPFVGRQKEFGLLSSCLDQVRAGRGRVAMIRGEPGVGKSRLAAEIVKEAERRGIAVVAGYCHDREDPLAYGPFVEIVENALSRAASLEAFRELLGNNAPDVVRVVPQLHRVMPDLLPSAELQPGQSRHLMFTGIAEFLARSATRRAMVLLLEDLHWADEATLMLLMFLAQRISDIPVLILGTYRDSEVRPDRPLAKALEDLIRSHAIQHIRLEGLSEYAVAEMLQALNGCEMPARFVNRIYSETEGNPFFVEELFKHLVEQGRFGHGEWGEEAPEMTNSTLPESIRLVIARRLSRLAGPTQKALGIAAVIGRSFTFELLEASSSDSVESLLDALDEAEDAGLIHAATSLREAEYKFCHELIRQAVLSGISMPRRQRLHLRVADAIESLYQGQLDEHTCDLAHHLWQAGSSAQPSRTIQYLAMAAKQEITQNAFENALRHSQNARELLRKLPDSAERGMRELDLHIDYGLALVVSKGNYAPEVGNAYKRARELSLKYADRDMQPFSIAFGLWTFHLARGEHLIARSYADEMVDMAERKNDDGMLTAAYFVQGASRFFMGEFADAHSRFEQGIARYDRNKHRGLARRFGQDAGLGCLCYDAMALWALGFPNRAEKRAEEALALARSVGEPFDLAWCLANLPMYYELRLDLARAQAMIGEGLALAAKHEFGFCQTALKLFRIIALSLQGKTNNETVAELHSRGEGVPQYDLGGTWGRAAIAGMLVRAGRLEAAEVLLDQASQMMDRNEERYFESEIYRIKGELSLKRAETSEAKEKETQTIRAQQSFARALAAARAQGSKTFELRAAVSLGSMMIRKGNTAEAAILVGSVYHWFTEGFDSPELIAARSLIDALQSAQTTSVP